jgi:hypothetical protein
MTLGDPSATAFQARPTFHLAPVFLQEPDSTDRREPMRSASLAPTRVPVNRAFAHLSTRGLTPDVLLRVRDTGFIPEGAQAEGGAADPEAPANVTVYTPAQIRAAYGMFALANASSVTSAQGAQMGAGQTIYIIDAQDDPNIAAELASFDSYFGLPGCTSTPIATSASLPLAAAPTTGCTFSVVYSDANGAMTASAPSYDSNWAVEIALDVQWAHATAPFARIILIEAPNAGVMDLLAAVQLANQMGPGIVSQSFGAPEGSWVTSLDATYSAANMTYLAATGDAGAAVNWPAASAHVLAVAGTSLTYSGAGPRTETVWSGTGGGESAYVPTPAYQTLAVPGLQPSSNREVADVTFNADPYTGQYVAVISQDATTHVWQPVAYWVVGGTSLATPQWAGLIAIANALRAQSALAPMGAVQPAIYDLGVQAGSYASAFLDVRTGSDGSCATCAAGVGYDLPSGLGSPNVAALLAALSAQTSGIAPIVTSATVSGSTEAALSFSITATAAHPLTYSLTGAPAGMSVQPSTGVVSWSAPVLGSYSVLANALDAQTGLWGQGLLSVTIVNPPPPHVAGGAIAGSAATPLSFAATTTGAATGVNLGYRLSGEPSGMWISAAGIVSWPDPLAGVYPVTVTAVDLVSGLTGQGLYTVTIAPVKAPSVASESVKFASGGPISFHVTVNATNPLTFSLAGEPAGMTISSTGTITWKTATAGTFGVKVTAYDAKTGLSGTGIITVSITQSGPVIALTPLKGVAGKALTGSIAFTDSTATVLSISVKGAPYGMSFAVSGKTLVAKWASPKTGRYSLKVTAVDSKKLIATATIPLTITAH